MLTLCSERDCIILSCHYKLRITLFEQAIATIGKKADISSFLAPARRSPATARRHIWGVFSPVLLFYILFSFFSRSIDLDLLFSFDKQR